MTASCGTCGSRSTHTSNTKPTDGRPWACVTLEHRLLHALHAARAGELELVLGRDEAHPLRVDRLIFAPKLLLPPDGRAPVAVGPERVQPFGFIVADVVSS